LSSSADRPDRVLARFLVLAVAVASIVPARAGAQEPNRLGSIRGIVFDSLIARAPLAGALVDVLELGRRMTTDERGGFRFDSVPAGRYHISFTHPALTEIGFTPPERIVELGAGIDILFVLATPAGATIYRRLCPGLHEQNTGVLLGVFSIAATGDGVPGAAVSGEWTETTVSRTAGVSRRPRIARASADSSGRFQLCGIPTDVPVVIRGAAGSFQGPPLELDLAGRPFAVRHVSVDLSDSTGRGTAIAAGTVTTADGKPLADVQVLVLGSPRTTRTRSDGSYALTDLPAGSLTLEARAIGYRRSRIAVELTRGVRTTASFAMTAAPVQLPEVAVATRAPLGDNGFDTRRAQATGYFITRADIIRRGTVDVGDLFKTVPGLQVQPIGGTDYQILSSRGAGMDAFCVPLFYLDRVPMVLDPETTGGAIPLAADEVAGIEIYRAPADAPPEFQKVNQSCAIILIWTRRGRQ
jgi:hypothetical protein